MKKRKKYLTTEELKIRWNAKRIEIYDVVKDGLIEPVETDFISMPIMGESDLKNRYFDLDDIEDFERSDPQYVRIDAPYISPDGDIPPYLKKGHKLYREELVIAIDALMNIYDSDFSFDPKRGHQIQINEWIANKYPDTTNDKRNRIARMINTRGPGTPKIGE